MGKIVMPKNSALLEEIEAVLKIYYEANDWLENDVYKTKLKEMIGDDQYASSYTKKSQITSYFGFTIWEDISKATSRRKITNSGIEMYKAIVSNDKARIQEIIMYSLEHTIFGRNNFGCPESNSDVEPPSLFIRASLDLKYLTYKEFAYLLWKLEDIGQNYTDAVNDIKNYRGTNSLFLGEEASKYQDCKPIMILLRWGFLTEIEENGVGKKICLDDEVLKKYKERLKKLKIYNVDKNIEDRVLNHSYSLSFSAYNKIYYGAPGCGKSYYVENELLPKLNIFKENVIRTTFYQDYSNTDFVGQILPRINDDDVTYEFTPGPFALALKASLANPQEPIALIIEEINRGNAASIFGDIFQLLDRKKDGTSEYAICNVNLQKYIKDELSIEINEIKIPSNLYIIGTMNTSDQNVFTLDTAFKRRWKFEKIKNKFDGTSHDNWIVPGTENITWKALVEAINEYMVNTSDEMMGEDKQIGTHFIDENGLAEKPEDSKDEGKVKEFAYKMLEYLWDDVAKFGDRNKWFDDDIKTLDQLIDNYEEKAKDNKAIEVFGKDLNELINKK